MLKAAAIALATLLLSGTTTPDTPTLDQVVNGLQTKYETVTDFKATFKQVVKRKHLPRPLKKQGTVYFKKPGMMRWDYAQPDRIYYVSDGEVLWSYQPADKLVHKLRVKDSELYSALNFLFGQGNLREEFTIALGGVHDGLVALKLTPKVNQSNYKLLTLHLDPSTWEIRVTELVDPLDNVSTVSFIDPTYDTLKVDGFKFTPPKGVRVEDLQAGRGGRTP
jgi:outer membrane lipoprotein carrier protein